MRTWRANPLQAVVLKMKKGLWTLAARATLEVHVYVILYPSHFKLHVFILHVEILHFFQTL